MVRRWLDDDVWRACMCVCVKPPPRGHYSRVNGKYVWVSVCVFVDMEVVIAAGVVVVHQLLLVEYTQSWWKEAGTNSFRSHHRIIVNISSSSEYFAVTCAPIEADTCTHISVGDCGAIVRVWLPCVDFRNHRAIGSGELPTYFPHCWTASVQRFAAIVQELVFFSGYQPLVRIWNICTGISRTLSFWKSVTEMNTANCRRNNIFEHHKK